MSPAQGRELIDQSLPRELSDRAGWIRDIYDAFAALDIAPTRENVCAVIAVTAQESGFQVDPVVPNLGSIAWREIDRRAGRAGIPAILVREVLKLDSPTGESYAARIGHARTEKELSDVFEDFTGSVPLGRSLFASWNPIRTRGPMQVNVAFADQFAATHTYPYPVKVSIDEELFTRRGSLYFGTAHLLDYSAPYDRFLFRFADFNAGQYASRNAAFQGALSRASGVPVTPDGALLPHGGQGPVGATELAARTLAARLRLDDQTIHAALEEGRRPEFERSAVYQGVFRLADRAAGHHLPRAAVPRIELEGPKIERRLTTDWYARRVDGRFRACLAR
ncbi:MAG TPA: DUF1615 domain-containing protein [Steroidobacteraceae bacterium]|nr:DUF1615 domain-containing protein [Steroidobacteraceae bacterium]